MNAYILTFIGILIIPILAQIYVMSSYKKYKKRRVKSEISGFEVARNILDRNGLQDVHVVKVGGMMSDHYDPRRKVVRLSPDVFDGTTIASSAIAAHECGHAIQDKERYLFMKIRHFIFPVVNITSYAAYIFLIISFIISSVGFIWIAILCMSFGVLFQLVTLPVELNASRRAKGQLKQLAVLNQNESNGASTMLRAAALTYVAGLVASLLEILRLVILARNN